MAELWFSEQADTALRTLEADPTQDRLMAEINNWLHLLERNPNDADCRRRIYVGGTRRIDLPRFAWMIVWETYRDGDVYIRYIGPDL